MPIRNTIINSWFLPVSFWYACPGYPSQADFICPQAFGRNTYSDEDVGMYLAALREAAKGDQIAVFQELHARGFDPGEPNRMLALRCIELAKTPEVFFDQDQEGRPRYTELRPVIGQWEVLYAMWRYEPGWYRANEAVFLPIWPPVQGYMGTRGMLLAVKEVADSNGLDMPAIVAHPEHLPRSFFLARKVFGERVVADRRPVRYETQCFDPRSVQKWTRDPGAWLRYEMLARIHHRLHGWM